MLISITLGFHAFMEQIGSPMTALDWSARWLAGGGELVLGSESRPLPSGRGGLCLGTSNEASFARALGMGPFMLHGSCGYQHGAHGRPCREARTAQGTRDGDAGGTWAVGEHLTEPHGSEYTLRSLEAVGANLCKQAVFLE